MHPSTVSPPSLNDLAVRAVNTHRTQFELPSSVAPPLQRELNAQWDSALSPFHQRDRFGMTELMRIASEPGSSIATANHLRLTGGASVNDVVAKPGSIFFGFTTMGPFVQAGKLDAVRLLLQHGADPNQLCPTPLGTNCANPANAHTMLMLAADAGNLEIVQVLLDHGADPNISTGNYDDALTIAEHGKHPKVVELLFENGANPKALKRMSHDDCDEYYRSMRSNDGNHTPGDSVSLLRFMAARYPGDTMWNAKPA